MMEGVVAYGMASVYDSFEECGIAAGVVGYHEESGLGSILSEGLKEPRS